MEGINILATKLVLDYGIVSMWILLISSLVACLGIWAIYEEDSSFGCGCVIAGIITIIITVIYIFSPVEAKIATIEDDVPYKYIEEHYRIKDKTDNLYTLIPLEEKK